MQSALLTKAQAAIGFGLIRHARLKPVKHVFAYKALFVRLPMVSGFNDSGRWFARNRAALLSFRDKDHGAGGPDALAWIRTLLLAGGVRDADGEIWLHTFPRMFGFAFKPVSFWYCERGDGSLRAVVAEVNNTFGERHCYLLENLDPAGQAQAIQPGQTLHASKVFHVSPFNPVQGTYQFRFLVRQDRSLARIDYLDADGCVLETSISGKHQTIGASAVARALRMTPWFTLGVLARIHWHAIRLWLKKVPFYRKPEPPLTAYTAGQRTPRGVGVPASLLSANPSQPKDL
jgi:uncharacterized protein